MVRKSVLHISTAHRALDTRIFHKECVSLSRAGFDVTVMARHDRDEKVSGVRIIGLPTDRNRFIRMFFGPFRALYGALGQHVDVAHFHDLELFPVMLALKAVGKKVVFDYHENYTAQVMGKKYLGSDCVRMFIRTIVRRMEKGIDRMADAVVAATDPISFLHDSPLKVTINNFAILETIDRIAPAVVEKKRPVVVYSGALRADRCIREIVGAMNRVGNEAELWLMGAWSSPVFREECLGLSEKGNVKDLGFLDFETMYSFIKAGDVGIALSRPHGNSLEGQPNKLFEYAACGKPIITSDFLYRRKLLGEAAAYVDPLDPESIAYAILDVVRNPERAAATGRRGRLLTEERFSWESEARKLVDLYRTLVN
ncbi:MAG TPA: glycosyltransferase [Spirochaetia bacterium]|nr:glycosyltransferase [Spirochaetales bacterium]HRY80425.1 glycosyltransferase [Spirochaetia bacterium]HRZ89540.1 glycosyltransferase [Spirochaetia bacterium]